MHRMNRESCLTLLVYSKVSPVPEGDTSAHNWADQRKKMRLAIESPSFSLDVKPFCFKSCTKSLLPPFSRTNFSKLSADWTCHFFLYSPCALSLILHMRIIGVGIVAYCGMFSTVQPRSIAIYYPWDKRYIYRSIDPRYWSTIIMYR